MPTPNLVAILAAAAANFFIGALWYAPPVFGKTWIALIAKKPEELMRPWVGLAVSAATAIVSSAVLHFFLKFTEPHTIHSGIYAAVLAWAGFVATTHLLDFVFVNRPYKLYLINMGYQLVAFVAMGAILSAMGK